MVKDRSRSFKNEASALAQERNRPVSSPPKEESTGIVILAAGAGVVLGP